MEFGVLWFVFAGLVAFLAASRGRSGFGWFLLAAVISPLLAALLLMVLKNLAVNPGEPTPATHVKCPDCRELILKDARVCKHCGCKLVPQ